MASVKRFEGIKCITLVLVVLIANTERSICLIKNIYFEKNTTLVNLRKSSKSCKMLQSLRLKELINASIGTHDNIYFNLPLVVSGGSHSEEVWHIYLQLMTWPIRKVTLRSYDPIFAMFVCTPLQSCLTFQESIPYSPLAFRESIPYLPCSFGFQRIDPIFAMFICSHLQSCLAFRELIPYSPLTLQESITYSRH